MKSVRNFIGHQGAMYEARINTRDMTYSIKNLRQQKIVKSTEKDGSKPPTTIKALTQQVKRALKKLGVKFEHEFRLGE